ncbi:MAG: ASKHA domain-containing protein [Candidatus Saccharibacteria bacterium]
MSIKSKIRIQTASEPLVAWVDDGQTLWDAIQASGLWPAGDCGGRGICGKCKVKAAGELSHVTDDEKEYLLPEELAAGFRLACRCQVLGEAQAFLPDTKISTSKSGMLMFENYPGLLPAVNFINACIPRFEKKDPAPLLERIQRVLKNYKMEISPANLNLLNGLDKGDGINITAGTLDDTVIRVFPRHSTSLYGLAIDIGTTSLACVVVDLVSGRLAGQYERPNSQISAGRDILSRVSFAGEKPGNLEILHRQVMGDISEIISEITSDLKIDIEDILEVTVVGNPVMLHLFLGLDPKGLGAAPYTGLFQSAVAVRSDSLGLPINPAGRVYVLPQIAGFLGADIVGCLLVDDIERPGNSLLIDIGTNGEMALRTDRDIAACSVAAGSAFEGGGITCGMVARNGAIDRVWLDEGKIKYSVLGKGKPLGICGSGLVDLLAVLLDIGALDETGLIIPERFSGKYRQSTNGTELIIIPEEESAADTPVVFNQSDVRELQLAKGAVRAGIEILLREEKLQVQDVQEVLLAGAFGNHLNPHSLIKIGMLPGFAPDIIKNFGNAAVRGAVMALISAPERERASEIANRVRAIELANREDFSQLFVESMNLR